MALKDKFQNIAQWYTERLRFFLEEHHEDYPLYHNPGTGVDVIFPKHDSFDCNWYLGESHEAIPDFIKTEFPGTYGCE